MKYTVEDLFELAEQYGCVTVFGDKKHRSKYRAVIHFQTIPGVELDASSDVNPKRPVKDALKQAIKQAIYLLEEHRVI